MEGLWWTQWTRYEQRAAERAEQSTGKGMDDQGNSGLIASLQAVAATAANRGCTLGTLGALCSSVTLGSRVSLTCVMRGWAVMIIKSPNRLLIPQP